MERQAGWAEWQVTVAVVRAAEVAERQAGRPAIVACSYSHNRVPRVKTLHLYSKSHPMPSSKGGKPDSRKSKTRGRPVAQVEVRRVERQVAWAEWQVAATWAERQAAWAEW